MPCRVPCLLPLLFLASCATTNEPGWKGTGAKPFDGARDSCQAQAREAGDRDAEAAAFEACMQAHGWSKGT